MKTKDLKVKRTKRDLAKLLSGVTGIDPKGCGELITDFLTVIEKCLLAGESVELQGIGKFEPKEYKDFLKRNPSKPENMVKVPLHRKCVYTQSFILKAKLNGDYEEYKRETEARIRKHLKKKKEKAERVKQTFPETKESIPPTEAKKPKTPKKPKTSSTSENPFKKKRT